jgi:hypothetical protein
MAGALPRLGQADKQAIARAASAIERLRTTARHPQRDLNTLGELWFRLTSCFRSDVGVAPPTSEGIAVVTNYLHHPVEEVANAAGYALSSAIAALHHREDTTPEPWPSMPEGAEAVTALARALTSPHALVRVAATGVLARYPAAALNDALRRVLSDSVFTVRWQAITALARTDARDGLREVLMQSLPRKAPEEGNIRHPFWEAVDALGEREAIVAHLAAPH